MSVLKVKFISIYNYFFCFEKVSKFSKIKKMVVLGYFAENVVCCQKNIITCHLNLKKRQENLKMQKIL